MDMIEYAIHSLGRQARGIADLVPSAAEALAEAAGERHSARGSGEMNLEDDTPEAQREQLAAVEKQIGVPNHSEPLAGPRWETPPDDRPLSALPDEDLFAICGDRRAGDA